MSGRFALLLLHFVASALLLWLGYYWLGLDGSDIKHLAWSGFVVLLFVAGFSALHGWALAYFSGLTLRHAAERSLRNLFPLLAVALFALAIYGALLWASHGFGRIAYLASSSATLALRKPVPPSVPERVLQLALWLLRWVAIPAMLLPLARAISLDGWRAWNWRSLRRSKRWPYWIQVAISLLCALWLPFKFFFWIPPVSAFSGQLVSFVLRAGLGYLLFVTAALALDFFTSSGKPLETQPSTVASP